MGTIRFLKQVKCLECDTIGILCKSLCGTCYRKKIRNTPEGRLKIKSYNDKVASQKLLNKKPLNKEPKQKKLCACGRISVAKNLCRNCYQNIRNKKIYIPKPRLRKPKKEKLVDDLDKIDLSIKKSNKSIGKYFQKARVGQSKTKSFVMKEISEYIKYDSIFGNACYLSFEHNVLDADKYFDCQPIYIDMNKIYKH